MRLSGFIIAIVFASVGCTNSNQPSDAGRQADGATAVEPETSEVSILTSDELAASSKSFGEYWNRGLAEVNRYELEQMRYGEVHEGEFVGIFVTEPFLTDKQVKYEFGPRDAAVKVLKLNTHRRFYTGVYPYNVHTSTFVPTLEGSAFKVAFSATEWCGLVYAQLNRRNDGFDVTSHSYFQKEGDERFELQDIPLENELWVQLRKGPDSLPTGQSTIVPDLTYLRLMHKEIKGYAANAERIGPRQTEFAERSLATYRITYPELDRTLELFYEPEFPHRIFGFKEVHEPLFRRSDEAMETVGRLTNSVMLDYWSKNSKADSAYRSKLGLSY